jgi:hypothetical protein
MLAGPYYIAKSHQYLLHICRGKITESCQNTTPWAGLVGLDTSAVIAAIPVIIVVVPMIVPACCWSSLPIVHCPCLLFVFPAHHLLSLPFVCYPSIVPTCHRAVIQYSSTHAPPHEQWLVKLEVGACCCHLWVLWFHQPPCEQGPTVVVASLSQV